MFFVVLSTYVFAYLYRKLPPQQALNRCNPKCSQIGMKWDSLFEALFYFSVPLPACDIIIIYHHEKLSFIGVKSGLFRSVSWTLFKIFLNHDFLE